MQQGGQDHPEILATFRSTYVRTRRAFQCSSAAAKSACALMTIAHIRDPLADNSCGRVRFRIPTMF
jgi:hypothetical protein